MALFCRSFEYWDGGRMQGGKEKKLKELELYIHIPFCVRKCRYCDFLSAPATEAAKEAYMKALCREMQGRGKAYKAYEVVSVFIGGGTPTAVKAEWIGRVMELIRENYQLAQDAEITMEMNPGTVSGQALEVYRQAGINRLSIGLQSADNAELAVLGRIHTYEQFLQSYVLARKAGFSNINVDVMSALPGQSLESYRDTLKKVTALEPPPEHISAYSLIIEEGTPFFADFEAGRLDLPSEEAERRMYEVTEELLGDKGYKRYEISNYAMEGKECRHNIGYWERREYLGFGIGAASLINNVRFSNTEDIARYEEAPFESYGELHKLSRAEQMEETMFLGLRMIKGVSLEDFEKRFGVSFERVYGEIVKKHMAQGLLQWKKADGKSFLCLTHKGLDVSNYVMADFLEPALF